MTSSQPTPYLVVLMHKSVTAYWLRFLLKLLPQAHHEPRALIVGKDIISITSFTVEAFIACIVHRMTAVFILLDPYAHRHVFEFE